MQEVFIIFDIGKTNKKCLVFNRDGSVVKQYNKVFDEIVDEDGFACENLLALAIWVTKTYALVQQEAFEIKGINVATYGASLVYVDEDNKPLTPLYNYLKPLPQAIEEQFLQTYFNNNKLQFAQETGSPFMGMLNSGLQIFWLKHTQPAVWQKVKSIVHFPQYIASLFHGKLVSDYTSLGCHTGLLNIKTKHYHSWVVQENIEAKLAPICTEKYFIQSNGMYCGIGLHDSSSALIPYINYKQQSFLLISTGTWCINLNPFNKTPISNEDLEKDSLCYLQVNGNPVKSSRIFLGKEHEYQTQKIAAYFNVAFDFYTNICTPIEVKENNFLPSCMQGTGPLPDKHGIWDFTVYNNEAEAYNALLQALTSLLKASIDLIDTPTISDFYIDGGFAKNILFKHYLQQLYPKKKINTLSFNQATALGALQQLR